MIMELKKQRALLMTELDEYYKRLEFADRYDNRGDKLWYCEVIAQVQKEIEQLEKKIR